MEMCVELSNNWRSVKRHFLSNDFFHSTAAAAIRNGFSTRGFVNEASRSNGDMCPRTPQYYRLIESVE